MSRAARATVADLLTASEGNYRAPAFHGDAASVQPAPALESSRNSLSRTCLVAAVDHSGVPRKQLADEIGMSESQFSKTLGGLPGGDFCTVADRIRESIRLDYARRFVEAHRAGGLDDLAAEDLAHAAIRYLAVRRIAVNLRPVKAALKGGA